MKVNFPYWNVFYSLHGGKAKHVGNSAPEARSNTGSVGLRAFVTSSPHESMVVAWVMYWPPWARTLLGAGVIKSSSLQLALAGHGPNITPPKGTLSTSGTLPTHGQPQQPTGEEEREGENLSGKSKGKARIREICKCSRKKLLNKILKKRFWIFFFLQVRKTGDKKIKGSSN